MQHVGTVHSLLPGSGVCGRQTHAICHHSQGAYGRGTPPPLHHPVIPAGRGLDLDCTLTPPPFGLLVGKPRRRRFRSGFKNLRIKLFPPARLFYGTYSSSGLLIQFPPPPPQPPERVQGTVQSLLLRG